MGTLERLLPAATVFLPFALACVAPVLVRYVRHRAAWLLAAGVATLTVIFTLNFLPFDGEEALRITTAWAPSLGLELSLQIDGLSAMFTLLITGIGTLVLLYANAYIGQKPRLGSFLALILAFMGAMLGVVLAGDVITLFVFWELTSVCSFLLIGFDHQRRTSRRAALQSLAITGGGGLLLLVGLIWLGELAGSYNFDVILKEADSIRDAAIYPVVLVLVAAGAFTKSAQFPFHFWLPNAMEAPTPVSAYLHSATMVKAGVFLLARLHPILGDTSWWSATLISVGAVSFLLGAFLALSKRDLKQILAQTTVSSLGLMVMLLGIGSDKAIEAAMAYLVAHACFKGALFMVAGAVDHQAGTRDLTKLHGLRRTMPATAVAGALAALSMAGLPPFVGFLAKEITYAATLSSANAAITAITVVANACMMAAALAAGISPFVGEAKNTSNGEGSVGLWLGALVLGSAGLVMGFTSSTAVEALLAPAIAAVAGRQVPVELHLVPELHPPLGASLVTIALGAGIFLKSSAVRARWPKVAWSFDSLYDAALDGATQVARKASAWIQTGLLRHYMHLMIVVIASGTVITTVSFGFPQAPPDWGRADFHVWGIGALTISSATVIILSSSRLPAILSMGVLGLSVALTFLLFGGPDLAFTQLMVETLSVVVLALVLTHLPVDGRDRRPSIRHFTDGFLALAIGCVVTVTLWMVIDMPFDQSLNRYFGENSYLEAHGRNIVNVILVDFRAVDTLGEIIVVMSTGVAVLALLRRARKQAVEKSIS